MNENILYDRQTNFINSLKFKIPLNASITDLKIRNIRFFSKILSKGKIAIYGNYEILVIYNIYLANKKSKNISACRKTNFYKVLKSNTICEHTNYNDIKASINFLTRPRCLYSIHSCTNSKNYLGFNNFCKVYLLSSLSITLLDKNKNSNNKKSLYPPQNDTSKNYITKENVENKKSFEATTIIGRGSIDLFIEKDLYIPITPPSILTIDNVKITVDVTKLNLINEKVIASGFVNIDINYSTSMSSYNETTTSNLNYIQAEISFSTPINLKMDIDTKPKESDAYEVLNAQCLGETHELSDALNITSGEVAYNKITEQFILQIQIITKRKEKIFI